MSYYLRSRGIDCIVNAHYRSCRVAHRWSTAHSIVAGKITLEVLRQLPDGQDSDGNIWFRPEWDCDIADAMSAAVCPAIVENAVRLGPPKMAYAREGYRPLDPRRRPNAPAIPISAHVYGGAIDLNIIWAKLDGPWSNAANTLIQRFGLVRPYRDEPWHVEYDTNRQAEFSLHDLVIWKIKPVRAPSNLVKRVDESYPLDQRKSPK